MEYFVERATPPPPMKFRKVRFSAKLAGSVSVWREKLYLDDSYRVRQTNRHVEGGSGSV